MYLLKPIKIKYQQYHIIEAEFGIFYTILFLI